ncbi:MAG: hypothetical protein EXX96DRAFT_564305 [Benjaminiella poitrasii]|nr:MAG: hypothetical protein EXX96DRAFT_564305 [Benjaminiella poitrasii]
MTKGLLQSKTNHLNSDPKAISSSQQLLSPEMQQEQAIMLEPLYQQLIGPTYDQSVIAIKHCRDICARFGFTIKQEASTHRSIYVYCSREGLADSQRNPKTKPQRRRPSKRCDCRWRVVLFENEDKKWEFRKSMNPHADKHNHELMRPEEVERSWPKEVTEFISELTRQRMATQDIRIQVQERFPDLHWNERRFYNRISEERQRMKVRESIARTHHLNNLWTKLCMATAGNEDLFQFVKQELVMLFQSICETVQMDPQTFPDPLILKEKQQEEEEQNVHDDNEELHSQLSSSNFENSSNSSHLFLQQQQSSFKSSNIKLEDLPVAPKGFVAVQIPKMLYYVKMHSLRQAYEAQHLKIQQQKTRLLSSSDDYAVQTSSFEPLRKVARKGKDRQTVTSYFGQKNIVTPESIHHHTTMTTFQPSSSNSSNSSSGTSVTTEPTSIPTAVAATTNDPHPAFVFSYDHPDNMTIDTASLTTTTAYDVSSPAFQHNYITTSPPTFDNTSNLSFSFNQHHQQQQHHSHFSTSSPSSSSSMLRKSIEPISNQHHHHHTALLQSTTRGESMTSPNSNNTLYISTTAHHKDAQRYVLPSIQQQSLHHPHSHIASSYPHQQTDNHTTMLLHHTSSSSPSHQGLTNTDSLLPVYPHQLTNAMHIKHPPPSSSNTTTTTQ